MHIFGGPDPPDPPGNRRAYTQGLAVQKIDLGGVQLGIPWRVVLHLR